MTFARWTFRLAGIYGLLALAPMYFLADTIAVQQPPAITHPEFFYGFIGVGLAWQLVFLVIATDPVRYRSLMPVAIVEKVSFGIPVAILFAQGRVAAAVLGVSLIDWLLGALFLVSYLKTRAPR